MFIYKIRSGTINRPGVFNGPVFGILTDILKMIVKNLYLNTFLILVISYLIGSFPSAYIAGRTKGINIYQTGSKNVGGMNTFSSVGRTAGVIVILADMGKGALACWLASIFSGKHPYIPLLALVAAVVGHNWMIYIGFRGGKGISTFIGGLLFLSPWSFLFLYLLFVPVLLVIVKDSYLSTAIGLFLLSLFLWAWEGSVWWLVFGLLVTAVYSMKCLGLFRTYFTHRRRDISPALKKIFKPIFKGIK